MDLRALKAAALFGLMAGISFFAESCHKDKKPTLPYYDSPDFTPLWLTDARQIDTLHTIAPFEMTDQDGRKITDKTFAGKIYIADFFYTSCPGICPRITHNVKILADSFQNNPDIGIISYSVTPDYDNVAQLKAYATRFGVRTAQWHMVTGNKTEIYTLARRSYFAEKEPGFSKDSTQFLHTEHIILVDTRGHIRGIYNGTVELEIYRMIADIRDLLKEGNS